MTTTEEASTPTLTPEQNAAILSRYEAERAAEEGAQRAGFSQLIALLPECRAILEKEGSRLKKIILISPDGVGVSLSVDGSSYASIKIEPYIL